MQTPRRSSAQAVTGDRLRRAFLLRAAGSPSPDLADRIRLGVLAARQARRATATTVATLLVSVTLLGVIAFRVGGQSPETPIDARPTPESSTLAAEPTPSESVLLVSAEPSTSVETSSAEQPPEPSPDLAPASTEPAAPSPTPTRPPDLVTYEPGPLRVEGIARVVATDGLRVRTAPTVEESSELLEPLLSLGDLLFVVDGPASADGYDWYQVSPISMWNRTDLHEFGSSLASFGWVAAGSRDSEPWIDGVTPTCPDGPTADDLAAIDPRVAVVCFGSRDHTVQGRVTCQGYDADGPPQAGPPWFRMGGVACWLTAANGLEFGFASASDVAVAIEAAWSAARYDLTIEITGRFDTPEARECRFLDPKPVDESEAELVLGCRQAFVMQEWKPLTD